MLLQVVADGCVQINHRVKRYIYFVMTVPIAKTFTSLILDSRQRYVVLLMSQCWTSGLADMKN